MRALVNVTKDVGLEKTILPKNNSQSLHNFCQIVFGSERRTILILLTFSIFSLCLCPSGCIPFVVNKDLIL